MQTKVTIRAAGSEDDLAVFKNNTWKGGGTPEMPWMVMLGWYLTLIMYSDSAAVAAT